MSALCVSMHMPAWGVRRERFGCVVESLYAVHIFHIAVSVSLGGLYVAWVL